PGADGRELVDIKATVSDALLDALRAGGAEIVASVPRFGAVRARVRWQEIEPIAARADVQFVKPAVRAMTNVGSQTSAGDRTHAADAVRATSPATGRGVKVGVLSDSVDFLPDVQASGDLGPVTVLPGQDGLGNTGEGTAMLEVVHDLAPEAELFFASAFISGAQFAQNILDLRKAGCDVIVDDIIYFDESPFMDGPIARAVNSVVADGAMYFSSAGNEGNKNDGTSGTWEGDFVDGGAAGVPINFGRLHSFGASTFNTVTGDGFAVTLFWADPYGASANDYDLYVLNSTGTTVIDASTNLQSGTQDPFEIVNPPAVGSRLVIVKSDNAQPRYLHMKNFRGRLGTSTSGACFGHAAAAGALAVAAVNASSSDPNPFTGGALNPVESFSSDGLRRVFFHPDGSPITPGDFSATGGAVRQKPDIAAADGVATATPGFNPFFGTSAAAPHAAAIAALVWSYNRALTPEQVRVAMLAPALDIEAVGVDRDSGVGIVMAPAAIVAVAPGPVVVANGTAIISESFLPASGAIDPGETVTVAITLRNVGGAPGAITARLLALGGVSAPGAAQDYGTLAAGGGQAARNFSFTANGAVGGLFEATLALSSGAVQLGNITVPFTLGGTTNGAGSDLNVVIDPLPTLGVGDVVTVTVTVFNNGPASANNVTLDSVLPGHLVPVGGSITQGGGSFFFQSITIDFGIVLPGGSAGLSLDCEVKATGTPTVTFFSGLTGTENNPANNTGSAVVTIGQPNLTPSQIVVSTVAGTGSDAATISANDPVFVDVAVANPGTGPATTAFASELYLDGVLVRRIEQQLPVAAGGAALALDVQLGPLAPGPHTLLVRTDAGGAVGESDEGDNEFTRTFTVDGPNLAPGAIVVSRTSGTGTDTPVFQTSDTVFIDFSTINDGQAATGVATTADVFVDGALAAQPAIFDMLGAGMSASVLDVNAGSFAPGVHTVRVVLDSGGVLAERDEDDNVFTRDFTVNAPPTISDITDRVMDEDQNTGAIAFTIGDAETAVASLTVSATSTRPSFLVSVGGSGANRTVTVTPMANANGVGTITVTVSDGVGGTASDSFVMTVNALNDPPSFTAGQNVTVLEDAGPQTFGVWAKSISVGPNNESGQAMSFSAMSSDPSLFSAGPAVSLAGTLTFTPAPDANGVATVSVTASDNGGGADTSAAQVFTITVLAVNDPPSFTPGGDVSVAEDSGPAGVANWATAISAGPANEGAQMVSFAVSNDRAALFAVQPAVAANGTLSFTPAGNANGSATVTVIAHDDAGGQTAPVMFMVNVGALDDPPSFTLGTSVSVAQDAGAQSFARFASDIRGGPDDEPQAVTFAVVVDDPAMFAVQPAIAANGALTFTPEPTASGSTMVSVTATDSGATSSLAQMFTIAVTSFAEETGIYNGLAGPLDAAGSSVAQAGSIRAVVSTTGKVTGKLLLGGAGYAFKGFVQNDGRVRFGSVPNTATLELRRRGLASLRLTLVLDVAGATGLAGSVSDGATPFATIAADRAAYDPRTNPAPLAGRYTALFPHRTGVNNGADPLAYPQGDGIGTISVGTNGVVKLRGTLADGGKISAASPLSAGDRWPIFARTDRGRGALAGFVAFAAVPGVSDAAGVGLLWHKPANARSMRYPDGWPGGVFVEFLGSKFVRTGSASVLTGFGATAEFRANDGGLIVPLVKALTVGPRDRFSVVDVAGDGLSLSFNSRSGLLSGRFVTPTRGRVPISGVVFQAQQRLGGFFAAPKESGGVSVLPAP
ncbi:MAG: CARDB domain-containing protein, partial [Chthoniobacteraceae bacterium]